MEGTFSLMPVVPTSLQHSVYCLSCYKENVEEALANYQVLVEQAKEIMIFDRSQGKETRFIKRNEDLVKIKDCEDYDEAIMKLAYQALQCGCNAVVDVDIIAEKVRTGSYQTQKFHGSGRPAQVKTSQLVKDRSIWSAPN